LAGQANDIARNENVATAIGLHQPKPQRFTDQQRDMVRFIFSQHNHFDADQLIDAMKKADLEVSRATVYRTLGKLVDAGLLRKLEIGPRMCYEHDYGYPQHDHLYCQQCHKLIEFASQDAPMNAFIHQFQYGPTLNTVVAAMPAALNGYARTTVHWRSVLVQVAVQDHEALFEMLQLQLPPKRSRLLPPSSNASFHTSMHGNAHFRHKPDSCEVARC
jgi:Fe2+ or Zn2+ uptake regulation protein